MPTSPLIRQTGKKSKDPVSRIKNESVLRKKIEKEEKDFEKSHQLKESLNPIQEKEE